MLCLCRTALLMIVSSQKWDTALLLTGPPATTAHRKKTRVCTEAVPFLFLPSEPRSVQAQARRCASLLVHPPGRPLRGSPRLTHRLLCDQVETHVGRGCHAHAVQEPWRGNVFTSLLHQLKLGIPIINNNTSLTSCFPAAPVLPRCGAVVASGRWPGRSPAAQPFLGGQHASTW